MHGNRMKANKATILWGFRRVIIWILWIERIGRIFEEIENDSNLLWDKVLFLALSVSNKFKDYPQLLIRYNWKACIFYDYEIGFVKNRLYYS